jgi:hypothetical protein
MSYTQLGYPAAFASEGNPTAGEAEAGNGEFDPYIHTEKDTMHIDDETGVFSLEVRLSVCFLLSRGIMLLISYSIWLDSPSLPLPMSLSRLAGITSGGKVGKCRDTGTWAPLLAGLS